MNTTLPALTYVTACDEAVVEGLLLSVVSFLHQHREAPSLRVCVIDGGIEAASWKYFQEKLEAWSVSLGLEVKLEKWSGDLERWQHFPPHWGSWAVYSSLDIFLKDIDGVAVFGDVDLFHGRAIWEDVRKVQEHPSGVGAVVDPFKPTSAEDHYVQLVRPEIVGAVDYVNTGFLIVDRSRFDREAFAAFLEALEPGILTREAGKRSLFDQSLLNGYFAGELALLDKTCNRVVRDARDLSLSGEPSNLHFVGQPKPWEDEGKVCAERYVAWTAASNALGLTQSMREFSELEVARGVGHSFRKLGLRLLGKKEKLEKLDSHFSGEKLKELKLEVSGWFQ